MSDNNENIVPSEAMSEDVQRLEQLVPQDATSRKRVLASLLRALNSDNKN